MSLTPDSADCDIARDLGAFVASSPTSYHASHTAGARLQDAGFIELPEARPWSTPAGEPALVRPGGKYFVVRDGAFIAFVVPTFAQGGTTAAVPAFKIVGAHTDSPALKVAPQSDFHSAGAAQVGVEIYGGPLLNSWLDRELILAGQLILKDGSRVLTRTAPIARIPQLAIHLDRNVNDGLKLDKQRHMQPVISLDTSVSVYDLLAAGVQAEDTGAAGTQATEVDRAGVTAADIAGMDIYTFPAQTPTLFGAREEFLAAPRLDNLSSVYLGLIALTAVEPTKLDKIAMLAAFDHEEVGSETRSGAAGPFLSDVTERIVGALSSVLDYQGREREAFLSAMATSVCISSDAGHALHPNYPERHDPVINPILGQGPLLKLNAQQRYASDAVGTAVWAKACQQAGVNYQPFVSNNTVPCGTTIGPLTATRLGMTTVDVGPALWSMHSAREMIAVADVGAMTRALHAFLALELD